MKNRLFLLILLAAQINSLSVQALDQDIDLTLGAPARPTYPITCVAGASQTVVISALNTNGLITWSFFGTPITIPPIPAFVGGASNPYVCQGLTIKFPPTAVSGTTSATIVWDGSGPATGQLNFTLNVDDADNSQAREYQILFRPPMDLMFVLDKSGSMNQISEGTITRWGALKTAAKNFMLKLTDLNFARPSVDKVGATFFDSGLTPSSFNTMISLAPGADMTLESAMDGLSPGGGTAIGLGLTDAKTKLADPNRSRNILLFTDGDQNAGPLVSADGCSISGTAINTNCPVLPGSGGNYKIFTVGIATPNPSYLTMLQQLAVKSGGNCLLTFNGNSFTNTTTGTVVADFADIFNQAFANLLRANSPQLVRSRAGNISQSGQQLVSFPLNKNVSALMIEVSLGRSFSVPELAQLTRFIRVQYNGRDVTSLATPRWVGSTPDTYLYVFSFNTERAYAGNLRSDGQWNVTALPSSPASGLSYRINVIADDHLIDYDCGQKVVQPTVGGTQSFTVTLSDRGKPISNANITATVYRPGDDVGDLMARNPLTVQASAQQTDRPSIGVLKFNTLMATQASFAKAIQPKDDPSIVLSHRGNGRYEGTYTNMNVAGIYQVMFRIQGSDSLRGTYDRYEMQSMYVQPGQIDLGKSILSQKTVNGQLVVQMRPVTTYGRFLGPAAADAFDVNATASSARLSSVVDNQDGSYTLTIAGNVSSVGKIRVLQKEVYSGRFDRVKISEQIPDIRKVFRPEQPIVLIRNPNFRVISSGTQLQRQPVKRVPK